MTLAIFISGLSAVIGQTLIIREMISFFFGNELISGIILFLWLLWTGIGSIIYPKIGFRFDAKKIYGLLLLILALTLIYSFLFIRIAPKIFSLPFGEATNLSMIIIISLFSLIPTCIIIGALFPSAATIIQAQKVYLIEGLGSFAGGIVLTFILINIIPPSAILAIVVTLLIFAYLILINKRSLFFLSLLPLLVLFKTTDIELALRRIQMRGQNLAKVYESKYGTIVITKNQDQTNFYTSGIFDFAYPDKYSAEEAVHYPLLLHKNPEDILLIGGGLSGAIEEILRHPSVKLIEYLELDPKIIEAAEEYIPGSISDNNVNIIIEDGRFYIKRTKKKFDCIIINLPDPNNTQLNRYYTNEFFKEVRRILKDEGIFSLRVNYTPDILSPLYSQFLSTINKTLNRVFKNVHILPVAKATYIATDVEIGNIKEALEENIIERSLELDYVNDFYIDYNITEERISYVKKSIDGTKSYINYDLKPVCYYFSTVLWGGVTSKGLKSLLTKLFNLNPIIFFLPLFLLFLFYKKNTVLLSVFSEGATTIAIEIILIILFQALYGYLYSWLGAITGLFMLGLAAGAYFFLKLKFQFLKNEKLSQEGKFSKGIQVLSFIHLTLALYILLILFIGIKRLPGTNYIILILILIAGFLCGIHFSFSVNIIGLKKAGKVYGFDLIGSSFGAIITTIAFIPILGIIPALLFFIILNLQVFLLLNLGFRIKV